MTWHGVSGVDQSQSQHIVLQHVLLAAWERMPLTKRSFVLRRILRQGKVTIGKALYSTVRNVAWVWRKDQIKSKTTERMKQVAFTSKEQQSNGYCIIIVASAFEMHYVRRRQFL